MGYGTLVSLVFHNLPSLYLSSFCRNVFLYRTLWFILAQASTRTHKLPNESGRFTCYWHLCRRGSNISEGTKYFMSSLEIFDLGTIYQGSKYSMRVVPLNRLIEARCMGNMSPNYAMLLLYLRSATIYNSHIVCMCIIMRWSRNLSASWAEKFRTSSLLCTYKLCDYYSLILILSPFLFTPSLYVAILNLQVFSFTCNDLEA